MTKCFYCDTQIVREVELDHFPIPQDCGGKDTVPACQNCHDLKDRTPVKYWDPQSAIVGIMGLFQKANRDERLLLAKMVTTMVRLSRAPKDKQAESPGFQPGE